jgi:hypothetical protein
MLANHSHERLIALGLTGMAKAFDDQQRQPDADALTQRLGLLIDREVTERENKRLITRLKFAALRQTAIIEQRRDLLEVVDDRHQRGSTIITSQIQSTIGTRSSPIPPSPTPSSTALSTTLIASH